MIVETSDPRSFDSGEVREVCRTIDGFIEAFARGDVDGIQPLFTEDAVVHPSNDRDREGWEDIADYWAPPFRNFDIKLRVKVRHVAIAGELAVAQMETFAAVRPKTGGEEAHHRYRDMIVLKRDETRWRIHRNLSQQFPVGNGSD